MKRKLVLLAMPGLVLAFGLIAAGCSKNDTASANNTAVSQEQSVATATAAAAQAAEKAAAETDAVAPTPAVPQAEPAAPPVPAVPAVPAAPKYAIGAEGPGGGIVFSNSGGKYKEVTKPESAGAMFDEPPSGWTVASIPDLKQVYDTLRTKLTFGDGWYRSSSRVYWAGGKLQGADYSRDHAMLSPGQTGYDRIREFFPDVQFILAAGGPEQYNFIRFTDGRILLIANDGGDFYYLEGEKMIFINDAKCLYVREF